MKAGVNFGNSSTRPMLGRIPLPKSLPSQWLRILHVFVQVFHFGVWPHTPLRTYFYFRESMKVEGSVKAILLWNIKENFVRAVQVHIAMVGWMVIPHLRKGQRGDAPRSGWSWFPSVCSSRRNRCELIIFPPVTPYKGSEHGQNTNIYSTYVKKTTQVGGTNYYRNI